MHLEIFHILQHTMPTLLTGPTDAHANGIKDIANGDVKDYRVQAFVLEFGVLQVNEDSEKANQYRED